MTSPFTNPSEPTPSRSSHQRVLSYFQDDWAEHLDMEQMFSFIDGVLPFEACLYYQVLPLFLEGSRLNLGMVSPDDASALEYVRRIVSYLNYALVPRLISSESHQVVLTAYLNHIGTQQAAIAQRKQFTLNTRNQRQTARARIEPVVDCSAQQTLILDNPQDLLTDEDLLDDSVELPQPTPEAVAPPPTLPFTPTIPPIQAKAPEAPTSDSDSDAIEPPPQVPSALINPLPTLNINAKHLSSSIEILATLSPAELLYELLGRVLVGGIGRLYFERQAQSGRVLWSQNGVLQSVMEQLEPDVLQGMIDELKRMTNLPLAPVSQPQNLEIERLYEQTRLLLRFRFMPTANGEEATLQVLRGAALKFYQQQQIANLERDALGIAKQLKLKLSEIRDRARTEPGLAATKLDALPALSELLRHIEEQLDALGIDLPNE